VGEEAREPGGSGGQGKGEDDEREAAGESAQVESKSSQLGRGKIQRVDRHFYSTCLQRERLAGDKDVAQQDYDTESAAYKLVITPYEREIYVITMIKIKINTHCDKLARGEESTFGAR
jgi:hypothetical protein